MLLAQSLVEYGVLDTLVAGVRSLASLIHERVSDAGPTTWAVIVGVALVGLWFWSRRGR